MNAVAEYVVAPPTSTPGRGRQLGVRIVENLFRRWPLFVIPVVLLAALGVVRAQGITEKYRSSGTVNVVRSTVLSALGQINTTDFTYETPAEVTSKDVNALLGSKAFSAEVATAAGLDSAIQTGAYTLEDLRAEVAAGTGGDHLVTVVANTQDPVLSQKLAQATIATYIKWVLQTETSQSATAEAYYKEQLTSLEAAVTTAEDNVSAYVTANPPPQFGERPTEEVLALQRLSNLVTQAQAEYDSAQAKLRDAQLNTVQVQADIDQRLRVIDEPETPTAREPIMLKRVITLATFVLLGLVVAIGALVAMAMLDRRVWSAADVGAIPGLVVIGVVTRQRQRGSSSKRIVPELTARTGT